ncbi:hypothetical protein OPT61_g9246 [Boeremia exigua]|uniref:Uncharacterized protein n=1 Tax=Boeremia exigua TaxID=749465 RepID=A0ACC2HUZ8_9PLEO|nr:hypothetical protein OPT61_g9246 [Boeremia exigua]
MAPKKLAVTSKALQVLLTRIGSASSGTKSALLARFQHDVLRSNFSCRPSVQAKQQSKDPKKKLRIMSIDMGIKNLAFCDAEVSHSTPNTANLDTHMNIVRWKKLDLVGHTRAHAAPEDPSEAPDVDDESNVFAPSALSKTAYDLIVKEVVSVKPDIILIEKQRWRSGGGSAVLQWTVRVNTLEAMLWAVLETLKRSGRSCSGRGASDEEHQYHVYAVDPKRIGQYWLGQHARALQERNEAASAVDMAALSKTAKGTAESEEDMAPAASKKPSRSKAEKSAKIAILRSWLAEDAMSTTPSTPSPMPRITFSIAPSAASTRAALLPPATAARRKKSAKNAAELVDGLPATEIKKLDDITDCFLQAAAWVAWESNRRQLLAASGGESERVVGEERILKMVGEVGEA